MKYIYNYKSPLGKIILSSNGTQLTGLWFEHHKHFNNEGIFIEENRILPVFEQTIKWLNIYFSGEKPDFMPEIQLTGTAFQMEVWDILQKIPYGEVVTYGDVAAEIARKRNLKKMSAQAVGGAVGHNPISIIIPCHRVVGGSGSLTGYGGGIDKKIALLELEKLDMKKFFVPKKGTAL